MTKVRCTVESCEFWGRGDYCTADEIQVNNNFAADEDDDLFYLTGFEVAEDPEAEPEREREKEGVSTSSQTYCETMRPK